MTWNSLKDYATPLFSFILFSFIGFSIVVWGVTGNSLAFGGFGLAIILVSIFVVRKMIPKQLLRGGVYGAALGAGLAFPIGLLVGQYLAVLFGYLAAAMWGIIVALVLVFVMGRVILIFLPMRAQGVIFGLAMVAGVYFGVTGIGSRIGAVYGSLGGSILIGWQSGMIMGMMVGYRNIAEENDATPHEIL